MMKVCIFNESNDISRFDVLKKVLSVCQLRDISDVLHWNRCSLSKCAWQWEENGKFDIPVDSLLSEVAEHRMHNVWRMQEWLSTGNRLPMTKDSNYRTKVKGYKNTSSPVNRVCSRMLRISPECATGLHRMSNCQWVAMMESHMHLNQPSPQRCRRCSCLPI